MRKLLGILMIFIGINIIGVDEAPIMPMIPLLPAIPNKPEVEGETQKDL